jgi:hypothetical protein
MTPFFARLEIMHLELVLLALAASWAIVSIVVRLVDGKERE